MRPLSWVLRDGVITKLLRPSHFIVVTRTAGTPTSEDVGDAGAYIGSVVDFKRRIPGPPPSVEAAGEIAICAAGTLEKRETPGRSVIER